MTKNSNRHGRRRKLDLWLIAFAVLGILAFSGNAGAYSSLNAQTTNPGSSIASGTLTMSNQVDSQTACLSSGGSVGTPVGNVNAHCDKVFTLWNVEPGQWSATTQTTILHIQNSGSLNASHLALEASSSGLCANSLTSSAPPGVTVPGVDLTAGSASASDTGGFPGVVAGMTAFGTGLAAGTTVVSVSATTLTMSQAATGTETPATVVFGYSTTVPGASIESGSATVTDSSGFPFVVQGMTITGSGITPYTIVSSVSGKTLTMSQSATETATETLNFGTTYGTQLNFNAISGTPSKTLCGTMLMFVQETAVVGSSTDYYCWYGSGSTGSTTGAPEASTDGLCTAPLSTTLSATVSSCTSATVLPLSALSGPIFANDTLAVTAASGTTCTFKATQTYAPTSLPASIAVTAGAYTAGSGTLAGGASVADNTTLGTLNADATDTISNFDSLHAASTGSAGPLQLFPITGAGTVSTVQTPELGSLSTRTFTIGLYFPNPAGSSQNGLQGAAATFGLTWYMSQ